MSSGIVEKGELDDPGLILHPTTDDPSIPPDSAAGVARGVEELGRVQAQVEVALLPSHNGGVEDRKERPPIGLVEDRFDIVGEEPTVGPTIE